MKSGICLLLLATNHDPSGPGRHTNRCKAGYDYAEVSLARIYSLSDNQLSDYRSLFLQSGLPVEVLTMLSLRDWLWPAPAPTPRLCHATLTEPFTWPVSWVSP